MLDRQLLLDYLEKSIKRQQKEKEKYENLETFELEIKVSKFFSWFGAVYLSAKSILLILAAGALVFFSFAILLDPDILLNDELKADMVKESKECYAKMAGLTLEETLKQLQASKQRLSIDNILSNIDKGIEKSVEQEAIDLIKFFAGACLFLAVILFYASWATKKIKKREKKIAELQTMTISIIDSFKESISKEEKDLIHLQEILKESFKKDT